MWHLERSGLSCVHGTRQVGVSGVVVPVLIFEWPGTCGGGHPSA